MNVKWSRSYPEQSLNFTASSQWMKATILSADKGWKVLKSVSVSTHSTPQSKLLPSGWVNDVQRTLSSF